MEAYDPSRWQKLIDILLLKGAPRKRVRILKWQFAGLAVLAALVLASPLILWQLGSYPCQWEAYQDAFPSLVELPACEHGKDDSDDLGLDARDTNSTTDQIRVIYANRTAALAIRVLIVIASGIFMLLSTLTIANGYSLIKWLRRPP